jgi:hypothetical protein
VTRAVGAIAGDLAALLGEAQVLRATRRYLTGATERRGVRGDAVVLPRRGGRLG